MRNKGQAEWMEVFMLICVAAIICIIIFALPEMMSSMASLFALGSAEAVSRDVAGLVTISGAAFEDAAITYKGVSESLVYNVQIKDKLVIIDTIQLSSGAGARGGATQSSSGAGVVSSTAFKHGVSRIPFDVSAEISAKNAFTITKSLFPDGSNYDIQVK
ncbi:MAG: hypothetical protein NT016_02890 [Candidatus Aenigmarchaeota archaeon]|nr:hypothetical protein [Candidatus Aenigmarchaeota archaeon]